MPLFDPHPLDASRPLFPQEFVTLCAGVALLLFLGSILAPHALSKVPARSLDSGSHLEGSEPLGDDADGLTLPLQ